MSAPGSELTRLTLKEASARLAKREVSSRQLTEACLARIAATDGRVGAFLLVTPERALAEADAADARYAAKRQYGPLDGVPIALKDIFVTRGVATTCASRILEGFRPPTTPPSSARLRAAGRGARSASSTWTSSPWARRPRTRPSARASNPWDLARVPGRLVGGSAPRRWRPARRSAPRHRHRRLHPPAGALLRRRRAEADLRPRLPLRRGRLRLARSTRSARSTATSRDAAPLLDAIAGHDPRDSTSRSPRRCRTTCAALDAATSAGCASACRRSTSSSGIDPEVRAASCAPALEASRRSAPSIVEVSLPHTALRASPPTTSSPPPRPRPTWRATTACATATRAEAATGLGEMYGSTRAARASAPR